MLDGLKKKTQNLTGTMSLNSQISDLDKANAALYSQLGREYFKRWQAHPVPELAQIVAAIEANIDKSAQLNEEIKRLKGIKKCPRCGNDMAYDAIFCPSCGCNAYNGQGVPAGTAPAAVQAAPPQPVPMPVTPPAAVPQPAPMQPAAAPAYVPVQQPASETVPVQAEAPAAESGRFCTGCGAPLSENAVFCTGCGAKAAAPAPSAAPTPIPTPPPASIQTAEPAPVIVPPASSIAPVSEPAAARSCESCGAPLPADAAFCTGCGARVSPQEPVQAPGRICPTCRAALPAEAGFCTNCGTRL